MSRVLAVVCALLLPALGLAAPVSRTNFNAHTDNSRTLPGVTPDRPVLQLFMNHVDRADDVMLRFAGPVYADKRDDWLRLRILDGCLNEVFSRDYPLSLTLGIGQQGWSYFTLGVPLQHGRYYYLELSTRYGGYGGSAQLMVNNSRYEHGRMFTTDSLQTLGFPAKKDDVMFILTGTVEETKEWYPQPTTNVLCPGRCQVVGTETKSWGLRNQFNVILQEPSGSFWTDYSADPSLTALKEHVRRVLEDPSGPPLGGGRQTAPLKSTVPYDAYYGQMNFYVAVENPAADPRAARGFLYCANIDAQISVKTGFSSAYGATQFGGEMPRPSAGMAWDYDFSRGILQHELLGHGLGQLTEEYLVPTDAGATLLSTLYPNTDAPGCPSWCGGSLTVGQLITQMQLAGDPNVACWGYDAATCATREASGATPQCLTIAGLSDPALAYYGGRACIPASVTKYNIGLSCTGNSGCYLGQTQGGRIAVNVAQPGGDIMGAKGRNASAAYGFTTPMEAHLRDIMDCIFPVTCHAYPEARCNAFQAKWSTTPGRLPFATRANACENSYYRRR